MDDDVHEYHQSNPIITVCMKAVCQLWNWFQWNYVDTHFESISHWKMRAHVETFPVNMLQCSKFALHSIYCFGLYWSILQIYIFQCDLIWIWVNVRLSHCQWSDSKNIHDDVIEWKHFPRCWPFVREIHRSPVNFPHKGQWHGALMFSFICARINGWKNNREAGDLRRYRAHYDVIVMVK